MLLTEAEGRLALAERKVKAFEQKYGTPLTQLRRNGLPNDASMEMHEDFVEWSGWQRTYEEASQIVTSLQHLVEHEEISEAKSAKLVVKNTTFSYRS